MIKKVVCPWCDRSFQGGKYIRRSAGVKCPWCKKYATVFQDGRIEKNMHPRGIYVYSAENRNYDVKKLDMRIKKVKK